MREKIECFKEYLEDGDERTNKELFILGTICLLAGIVIGFMMAPIKKGISIGSGNNISTDNSYAPSPKDYDDCCSNCEFEDYDCCNNCEDYDKDCCSECL